MNILPTVLIENSHRQLLFYLADKLPTYPFIGNPRTPRHLLLLPPVVSLQTLSVTVIVTVSPSS